MYRALFSLTCASLLAFQIVNIGSVILFNFFQKSQTPEVAQKGSWDHELKIETSPSNEKESVEENLSSTLPEEVTDESLSPTEPKEIVAEEPAPTLPKEVVLENLTPEPPKEVAAEEPVPTLPKEVALESVTPETPREVAAEDLSPTLPEEVAFENLSPTATKEIALEETSKTVPENSSESETTEELNNPADEDLVIHSEPEDLYSPSTFAPMRAALRYTTPEGIGYHFGYTSLTGFFAPDRFFRENLLPFLDVRGHLFDNGKWAANAGVGVRYLQNKNVFGANLYYDFRNSSGLNYNQVAVGVESLGRVWDLRLNGYLPVGDKDHTSGSHTKAALKALNAEAGIHVDHFQDAPLYFSAGPYYLNGKGKSSFGGEVRASIDLFDRYLRFEGNSSYDTIFKWVGQAQISLQIPLGNKRVCYKKEPCSRSIDLHERALQNVERHEIIPVKK